MKQFIRHTLSLFLLFLAGIGMGQEMSMDEYLDYLRKESLLIHQSANHVTDAELNARAAKSALLPSVSTAFLYQRDFSKNFLFFNDADFGVTKLRTNFNNSINADVIANQTLYDPVASAEYKVAEQVAAQAEIDHRETIDQLLLQGARLFLQTLFMKESVHIIEESLQLAQDQQQQTQDLYQQGLVSELELKQAELYYQQALPHLASARNSYQTLINELKALASIPEGDDLHLIGNITQVDPGAEKVHSLEKNLQLQSIHRELSMTDLTIRAREAAWNPKVKVGLGYNLNAQDNEFRFENENQLWYGRLSIQVPILTGGYSAAQLQRARLAKDNAQLQLQHTRQTLNAQLDNHYLDLGLARKRIGLQEEILALAEKEFEISTYQSSAGIITATDRKQIRLDLSRAKLSLLQAHLQARLTQLEIDKITGKPFINNNNLK
ncbi:MAG: TolC family protein [Bacteroidota bacterium]